MEKKEFSETKTFTSADGKTVVTTTVSGSVSASSSTVSSTVLLKFQLEVFLLEK